MTDDMTMAKELIETAKELIETAIVPVQDKLDRLQRQVNDQGRQTSKDCIAFEGAALKPLPDELFKDTCIRVVKEGWGLSLMESELKQVKLYPKGEQGDKYRMVAKFNNCFKGSNFYNILTNKPKVPNLFRSLHLVTKNDHRLDFIARRMRKAKELDSFIWHYVSGRLKVTFNDKEKSRESFSEADALFLRCSERLKRELNDLDKKARVRSHKRKSSSSSS